jgi:hypothetical protein
MGGRQRQRDGIGFRTVADQRRRAVEAGNTGRMDGDAAGGKMSTCVPHLPPLASLKANVTLMGRASAGIGKRATSTAQVPSSGDPVRDCATTGTACSKPANSKTTAKAFIRDSMVGKVSAARLESASDGVLARRRALYG